MFNLNNKVAIVTGSARGIGKQIAAEMVKLGAIVFVTDKEGSMAEQTAKEVGAERAIEVDVTKMEEVNQMVGKVYDETGSIDILVNNAGIIGLSSFENISLENWNEMILVHLNGTFLCSQAVLKYMKPNRSGKIINISSNWGQRGAAEAVHYSTVKAGIIGFTKALAREMAEEGILVNAVAPGPVDTEMIATEAKLLGIREDEVRDTLLQNIPIKRLGKSIEIAGAVCYLASDIGNFYCGQIIAPNGGEVI